MRTSKVDKGKNSAVQVEQKVVFDFDSKEEEHEYKKACTLLRNAEQKAMEALNTSRKYADFTSVTTKVHKGQLLVFIHSGMIG